MFHAPSLGVAAYPPFTYQHIVELTIGVVLVVIGWKQKARPLKIVGWIITLCWIANFILWLMGF